MKVLAYRAYSARKLANLTGAKKDDRLATTLENELLAKLQAAVGECNGREDVPVPETCEGSASFEAWVRTLDDRF